MLMLLQTRRKMPAAELAEALEVSVRTIYRDMNALSAAGVPVYTERGAEGGCCLVAEYTTDLTGLTEDEARALFLLAAPGPLDALDAGQKLKAALRKLFAALPQYRGGSLPQARIYLDWDLQGGEDAARGQLESLYQAAQAAQAVRIRYRLWNGPDISLSVHPLGLAARAGRWYLVYETQEKIRAQAVSDLLAVERLDEPFNYPAGFDLAEYWRQSRAVIERGRTAYPVLLRIQPESRRELARRLGARALEETAPADETGRVQVRAGFESLDSARGILLALGGGAEVLEPLALRLSLEDYARQILRRYAPS